MKKFIRWTLVAFMVALMCLIEVPKNAKTVSAQNQTTGTLLEFYGRECGPCRKMKPIVDSLEKYEHIKVVRYEVWNDPANERLRRSYDSLYCGGVPFFINPKTKKWICGAASYEALKDLAQGK